MNLRKIICSYKATIREVMLCINENERRTVFIEDDKQKIVGVMTDGDIRRLLIAGYGLNEKVGNHISADFIYATIHDDSSNIVDKFKHDINIIPIVDDDMRLVDYVEYNQSMHIALAQPQLAGNEYRYLMDAFLSNWISSNGKYIPQFEEIFSKYCGVRYGVATSNGTTALHLALTALDIGAGDEVIVPDITFAATINAVIYTGATPVIVDVEEDSWCIDPDAIERAVTIKTKAIIPVHIYGQPCNMGRLSVIAEKYGLYIVEDCAEAHGAEWDDQKVGSFGIISCFSFFGNKVITTGEGGMCITNDEALKKKMLVLRDHGMSKERKYYHEVIGFNYRMTNLQAAIGVAQVERIDEILEWRNALETQYREAFSGVEGVRMQEAALERRKKIAWLVSILIDQDKRDKVLEVLNDNDIDVRGFFIPLSEMKLYSRYATNCIKSRRISKMGLNLPTTYEIDRDKIEKIVDLVKRTISKAV